MLFLIVASLACFLALILISKKDKSIADKVLAFWMTVLGIHLFLYYCEYSGLVLIYGFLEGVNTPLPLMHGPLLYLYAKALVSDDTKLKKVEYLHFVPALLVVIYMIPFFVLSGADKIAFVENLANQGSVFLKIVLLGYMVSGVAYISLSLLLLRKHRRNLVNNFSSTDEIDLNWLRYLIIGMTVIWSIVIIGHLLEAGGIHFGKFIDDLIFVAVSGFVLMMGYFGIKQTTIFQGHNHHNVAISSSPDPQETTGQTRYQKSGLKSDQADALQSRLETLMQVEKPHLDDDLTLKSLAERLEIHPNYLSQVINERFKRNFYDFINTARIEEFKSLVQQPRSKNLTLLALAFECGFTSKSSFNKFFKKSTGFTPSAFMEMQKK